MKIKTIFTLIILSIPLLASAQGVCEETPGIQNTRYGRLKAIEVFDDLKCGEFNGRMKMKNAFCEYEVDLCSWYEETYHETISAAIWQRRYWDLRPTTRIYVCDSPFHCGLDPRPWTEVLPEHFNAFFSWEDKDYFVDGKRRFHVWDTDRIFLVTYLN